MEIPKVPFHALNSLWTDNAKYLPVLSSLCGSIFLAACSAHEPSPDALLTPNQTYHFPFLPKFSLNFLILKETILLLNHLGLVANLN